MRRLIRFPSDGETLVGTIDPAAGVTGLLIVSGGNEVRSGAHRGMALLAARLAATGTPVLRYDRRGIGDSTGRNGGYRSARPDLIAAAAALRREAPQVQRIVGFGNCDAATTLALFGRAAGIDAVVLANPWIAEEADALPPAAAIRSYYRDRLRDPRSWWRALTGGSDLRRLVGGLRKIATAGPGRGALTGDVLDAIQSWGNDASVILAKGDATAIAYADATARSGTTTRATVIPTASHSFARVGDAEALEWGIRAAL